MPMLLLLDLTSRLADTGKENLTEGKSVALWNALTRYEKLGSKIV